MKQASLDDLTASLSRSDPKTLFIHVVTSLDGGAIGVCVASVGNGVSACLGADSDPNDDYAGDVCHDGAGHPTAGATVRYFREQSGRMAMVAQTQTDSDGRHRVVLPPGDYRYGTALPLASGLGSFSAAMDPSRLTPVRVEAGHVLSWENAETVAPDTLEVGAPLGETRQTPISFVREEWLGDWNGEDGIPVVWPDVEQTLKALHERVTRELKCSVRGVWCSGGGGSKFPRPDLIQSLRRVGIPAQESGATASGLAVAYRNLRGLIKARLIELLPDERANFQLKQLKPERTRLVGIAGIPSYLAEARILCLSGAAPMAGTQQTTSISVLAPKSHDPETKLWKTAPVLRLLGQKPDKLERFS